MKGAPLGLSENVTLRDVSAAMGGNHVSMSVGVYHGGDRVRHILSAAVWLPDVRTHHTTHSPNSIHRALTTSGTKLAQKLHRCMPASTSPYVRRTIPP